MKAKIIALTSTFFVLICGTGMAQSRLLKKLMSEQQDTTRSPSFLPLPVLGYAQETGLELGLAGIYSFYNDPSDPLARNSTVSALASLTTKSQSNFQLKSDIWSQQNRYHYTTDIRYKNFPFNFYGIGDRTREADEDKLDQKLTRIAAEAEKLISKVYYAGLTADFENYRFKDEETNGIYAGGLNIQDKDGGSVLFLGISQIIDTRNTNTYTTKGSYLKINYSYAPDFYGGDNFTGSHFKADFRTFNSLSEKVVLGINFIYQSLQGDNSPFYLLSDLGNDEIMRGYYSGRYRDNNLLAGQAELRYRFISRLGVAAFLGAGNVYHSGSFDPGRLKPSYGGGLRYFFDVERGLSIRMDYGIGEKRPDENRQTGFYISFGESF